MQHDYTCSVCGARVLVLAEGKLVRSCLHLSAKVHANMSATVTAHALVAPQPVALEPR